MDDNLQKQSRLLHGAFARLRNKKPDPADLFDFRLNPLDFRPVLRLRFRRPTEPSRSGITLMSNGKFRVVSTNNPADFQAHQPNSATFDPAPAPSKASAEEGIQLLRAFTQLKDPDQRAWLIRAVERMAATPQSN